LAFPAVIFFAEVSGLEFLVLDPISLLKAQISSNRVV